MNNWVLKTSTVASFALLVLSLSLLRNAHAGGGLNPASPGLPVAVLGTDNVPNNGASAMCVSCHTFTPVSGKGSHFVSQTAPLRTTNNQVTTERVVAWNGSVDGLSKYGNYGVSPPVSVTGTNGQMICESCHSLIHNVSGGNNLLEYSYNWDQRPNWQNPSQAILLTTASTSLCEGCHVTAVLQGHHPMTGDVVTTSNLPLSNAGGSATRLFVDNVTQMGSGNTNPGSEVFYPGPNRLGCLSCHGNGHTGAAGTGARLVRRGWAGAGFSYPSSPLPATSAVVGVADDGTQRQSDKGATHILSNWVPLCDACHTADD